MNRPNILFLMSDEHRADVAGFAGNTIVRTPVLDELAQGSVNFTNAYTPSPACIPARQCLMSGQYPTSCNCEGWVDLAPGYMTFARHFTQYGYYTAACGKLHHVGRDQMQGWRRRIGSEMTVDTPYLDDLRPEEFKRHQRPFGDYKWSDAKEVLRAGIGAGPCVAHDAYAVEGALNFIEEYFTSPYYDRAQVAPLLLKVSLVQPHYPYFTSEEKFSYYLNRVEPYLNQTVADHPWLSMRAVGGDVDDGVTERDLRRATAAYYGMIETLDEHFGRVLAGLRHAGQDLDDWIIIYTSDHGEMLGEHGIWEKVKFYEASARVPLFIRWPRRLGPRVVSENVNLVDLFATLCDLTGIETPPGLDSRSLAPLLYGEDAAWDNETRSQFSKRCVMLKRDHLKYQYLYYYETEYPEVLFDLRRDPGETINFIDDPAYAPEVAAFRARMKELKLGPHHPSATPMV